MEKYPLHWPFGQKRSKYAVKSAFGSRSFAAARDFTIAELNRLGAKNVIISTNIPLRQDGLPLGRFSMPQDKGVAAYFEWEGRPMAFACDRWDKIEDNIYAIGKTIEAMRGIERWGSSDMMKAAFTGFEALPAPTQKKNWWEVLMVTHFASDSLVMETYKILAKRYHPDSATGSNEQMSELNAAYDDFKKERNIK